MTINLTSCHLQPTVPEYDAPEDPAGGQGSKGNVHVMMCPSQATILRQPGTPLHDSKLRLSPSDVITASQDEA